MRRYDDPVETRMGLVSGIEGPEQFLWRGRLWKVRAVVAHWVETGPWWQSGGARAVIGSDEIMGFATAQVESDGISERIDGGVDFGAQSSARAADRLVFVARRWNRVHHASAGIARNRQV